MIETKKKRSLLSCNWLEEGPQDAQVEVLGKSKSYSNLISKEGCNTCPNNYPLTFKDIPSFKEYKISGICQKCQDEVFRK